VPVWVPLKMSVRPPETAPDFCLPLSVKRCLQRTSSSWFKHAAIIATLLSMLQSC